MKNYIFLLVLLHNAACAPIELPPEAAAGETCDLRSLDEVFADPVGASGRRFCGLVRAIHEGRVVKFFSADAPLPQHRTNTLLLPDGATTLLLKERMPQGGEAILYIEGRLSADRECFENSEIMCLPYRHPVDIRVTGFRLMNQR